MLRIIKNILASLSDRLNTYQATEISLLGPTSYNLYEMLCRDWGGERKRGM